MAYKRTTSSKKSGGVTLRKTTTSHSSGKMPTVTLTKKQGNVTTSVNTKTGATWRTSNINGWVRKEKINGLKNKIAPKRQKARRKRTGSFGNKLSKSALIFLILVICFGAIVYFK